MATDLQMQDGGESVGDEEFTFAGLMDFVAEWAIVILAGIAALIFGAVVTLPLWFLK